MSADLLPGELQRPTAPSEEVDARPVPPGGAEVSEHFRQVHARYRAEMRQVLDTLSEVDAADAAQVGRARGELQRLAVTANDWALGGVCHAQCFSLTEHHLLEDDGIFPHLRASEPTLVPVLDQLATEHHAISDLLRSIDLALVDLVRGRGDRESVAALLHRLDRALGSHFAYEEGELAGPLERHGFYAGQLRPPG